jgi:hypothetical protein
MPFSLRPPHSLALLFQVHFLRKWLKEGSLPSDDVNSQDPLPPPSPLLSFLFFSPSTHPPPYAGPLVSQVAQGPLPPE